MPAAALGKPGADEFGLMARRIFHNDVDVEIGRNVPLDFIKEPARWDPGKPVQPNRAHQD
jgi:hypothetical protein